MADFISDEDMKKLEASQSSPDFISDEEMSKLEKKWYDVSPETLGKSALEALPIAGSIAGGIVGAGAGLGVGSIPGAVGGSALGAAAGKSLEQAGKALFFNEYPASREEQIKEIGKEAALGGLSEVGGQAFGKVLEKGIELGGKALPKIGHALTGVSEQEIKTYASRADKIKELAKQTDASTMEAADQIRNQFNRDIQSTISNINNELSNVLNKSEKTIDSTKIYDSLESYKSKLNKDLYPREIGEISDIQNMILNASKGEKIPVGLGNEIKKFLQEKASSAYRSGDIFQIGKESANAAKKAAAISRQLIDEVEPSVTKYNSKLQEIHNIEDSMNSNILKPGAPEAALMSAGTGGNVRNVEALTKLGEITGTPMLESAENLAAMRTFTNPPLLPVDTTGKSVLRTGLAAGIGSLSSVPGGAILGSALTSPMVLKGAIETGRAITPAVKSIIPSAPTREMLYKGLIQKYFESPTDKIKEEPTNPVPDQSSIMEKIKGTPYQSILEQAKMKGDQSFAAANYVLKNRDPKYRALFEEV